MAHENIHKVERVLELSEGLAIWKVHIDALREQDKNARVMSTTKFDRLTENMRRDKWVESLPLCTKKTNEAGNDEFLIISGHHRIRAARAAGINEIFVLVIEREMTQDEIRSKQLAHNALSGEDDQQLLEELFNEIQDIDAKMAAGITDADLDYEMPNVKTDDIAADFDFEILNVIFTPKEKQRFDSMLALLEPHAEIYLADKVDFDRMKSIIQETSSRNNVRNVAAIMSKMIDVVEEYYAEHPKEEDDDKEKG